MRTKVLELLEELVAVGDRVALDQVLQVRQVHRQRMLAIAPTDAAHPRSAPRGVFVYEFADPRSLSLPLSLER